MIPYAHQARSRIGVREPRVVKVVQREHVRKVTRDRVAILEHRDDHVRVDVVEQVDDHVLIVSRQERSVADRSPNEG